MMRLGHAEDIMEFDQLQLYSGEWVTVDENAVIDGDRVTIVCRHESTQEVEVIELRKGDEVVYR